MGSHSTVPIYWISNSFFWIWMELEELECTKGVRERDWIIITAKLKPMTFRIGNSTSDMAARLLVTDKLRLIRPWLKRTVLRTSTYRIVLLMRTPTFTCLHMLANPSDREDCLPHEAFGRPVAELTKLLTRLPFRTVILPKSSETTHPILPQDGQGHI